MPEGTPLAEAYVTVSLNGERFVEEFQAMMAATQGDKTVDLTLETREAMAALATFEAAASKMRMAAAELRLTGGPEALAQVAMLRDQMALLAAHAADLKLNFDAGDAMDRLVEFRAAIERTKEAANERLSIEIGVARATETLDYVASDIRMLQGQLSALQLQLPTGEVLSSISLVEAQLALLKEQAANIKFYAGIGELHEVEKALTAIDTGLDEIARGATIPISIDDSSVLLSIDEIRSQLAAAAAASAEGTIASGRAGLLLGSVASTGNLAQQGIDAFNPRSEVSMLAELQTLLNEVSAPVQLTSLAEIRDQMHGAATASAEATLALENAKRAMDAFNAPVELVSLSEIRNQMTQAHLASIGGTLAMASSDAALAGLSSGGSGSGGGAANFFLSRLTGKGPESALLQRFGMPAAGAQAMQLALPMAVGLFSALAESAVGVSALAVAAMPAAQDIITGYQAVNAANTAQQAALFGTPAYIAAEGQAGTAWAAIPMNLQPAVQAITGLFSGNSPVTAQAGQWLNNMIVRLTGAMGGKASVFEPLILATEGAISSVVSGISGAFTSMHFAHAIDSLSKMIGPAMSGLASLAMSAIQIFMHVSSAFAGGQGLKTLVDFMGFLASFTNTSLFQGMLHGWLDFERVILHIIQDVLKLATLLTNLIPGSGHVLGLALGSYLGLRFVTGAASLLPGVSSSLGAGLGLRAIATRLGFGGTATDAAGATAAADAAGAGGSAAGGIAADLAGGGSGAAAVDVAGGGAAAAGLPIVAAAATALALGDYAVHLIRNPSGTLKATNSFVTNAGNRAHNLARSVIDWVGGAVTGMPALVEGWFKGPPPAPTPAQTAAADKLKAALEAAAAETHKYTSAIGSLAKSSQVIGTALASHISLYAPFNVGKPQTAAEMLHNLSVQGTDAAKWTNYSIMLQQRGMSAGAVASLMNSTPQDLATLANGPQSAITAQMVQFNKDALLTSEQGKNGLLNYAAALSGALTSAHPAMREAAHQLLASLGNMNPEARQKLLALVPTFGIGLTAAKTALTSNIDTLNGSVRAKFDELTKIFVNELGGIPALILAKAIPIENAIKVIDDIMSGKFAAAALLMTHPWLVPGMNVHDPTHSGMLPNPPGYKAPLSLHHPVSHHEAGGWIPGHGAVPILGHGGEYVLSSQDLHAISHRQQLPPPPGGVGPAVAIGTAHFHSGVDMDALMQKTEFALLSRSY